MQAALSIESLDCFSHIATRKLLHYFFECMVFLPHDLIKPCGRDPRFLELLIGFARFDGFMLARVSHQQDSVAIFESVKKFVHLFSTRETRFVENVQSFLPIVGRFKSGEMPLQRARFDSCFGEFLGCA